MVSFPPALTPRRTSPTAFASTRLLPLAMVSNVASFFAVMLIRFPLCNIVLTINFAGDDKTGKTTTLCVRRATYTDPETGKEVINLFFVFVIGYCACHGLHEAAGSRSPRYASGLNKLICVEM